MLKISVLHPYLEERIDEIEKGLYPKHHLWGLHALNTIPGCQVELLRTNSIKLPMFIEKIINRFFLKNSPGIKAELCALIASRNSNLLYSVCGPLSLIPFFGKAKVISWVFRKPKIIENGFFSPYSISKLNKHTAFLCLTPNAYKSFQAHAHSKFLPWCVDLDIFSPNLSNGKQIKPFFLATGKTGRDYATLIDGAKNVDAELRIIGPKYQKPNQLPKNIKWIETSDNPPDQAIDYPTLCKWYANCIAVCVPLSGDADDTCGYTNMLEAMAMAKPVLMTRSGCLHINPKIGKYGILTETNNSESWKNAMNFIINHPNEAMTMGENGRKMIEENFTIKKFNKELVKFIEDIIK